MEWREELLKPCVSLKGSVWPVCTVITIYWLGSCYCGLLDVHGRHAFHYLLCLFFHVSDVYLRECSPEALRTDLFWWPVWLICGTAITDKQRRTIAFILNYAQQITWLSFRTLQIADRQTESSEWKQSEGLLLTLWGSVGSGRRVAIHSFNILNEVAGDGADPSWHRASSRVRHGRVASSSQGWYMETNNHPNLHSQLWAV